MEFLKAEGLTKSIGVGNFREEDLVNIRDTYRIPPAINQVSLLTTILQRISVEKQANPHFRSSITHTILIHRK